MDKISDRLVYLNGIRGLAALLVFFHHFLLAFYSAYYTFHEPSSHLHNLEVQFGKSVFSVFANGRFCVSIFFVLSGYVLSRKYFENGKVQTLVAAAQSRFARLYLPVAFTLVLACLLMKSNAFYNIQAGHFTHSDWWLGMLWSVQDPVAKLGHCLLWGTMFEGDASLDTCLWTMSVELYGSLLVFAFLALTHQTRNRLSMLLVVFVFFVLTNRPQYSTFILGISLNYMASVSRTHNKFITGLLAAILLTCGLVLGSFPSTFEFKDTIWAHAPLALLDAWEWLKVSGAFFVVTAFVLSGRLQRFISLRLFRLLGYISFSFYLLHPLIIGTFSSYLFLQLHERWAYNASVSVVFAATLAVCFLCSWLMTKYIDMPGTRLSKYLFRRYIDNSAEEFKAS